MSLLGSAKDVATLQNFSQGAANNESLAGPEVGYILQYTPFASTRQSAEDNTDMHILLRLKHTHA